MITAATNSFKAIILSSTFIVRSESDGSDRLQASASGISGSEKDGAAGNLDYETRTESSTTGLEDAVAKTTTFTSIMDQTQPAMIKDGDYVVDVILPTLLIALLFVGNAVIVYIIFHFRKRNVDTFRKTPAEERGEEIALSNEIPNGTDHQV